MKSQTTHNIPDLTSKERERFFSFFRTNDYSHCWNWKGSTRQGYGRFMLRGKLYTASRIMMYLHSGKQAGDFFVCHTCDNPTCVNPWHLYYGTQKQNRNDTIVRGRDTNKNKKHCVRGHLKADNKTSSPQKNSYCLECLKENSKKFREENRDIHRMYALFKYYEKRDSL